MKNTRSAMREDNWNLHQVYCYRLQHFYRVWCEENFPFLYCSIYIQNRIFYFIRYITTHAKRVVFRNSRLMLENWISFFCLVDCSRSVLYGVIFVHIFSLSHKSSFVSVIRLDVFVASWRRFPLRSMSECDVCGTVVLCKLPPQLLIVCYQAKLFSW